MATGALSQYGEELLLRYSLGLSLTSYTAVPTSNGLYAALITSAVDMTGKETGTDPNDYTEPTSLQYGATYARVQLTPATWVTQSSNDTSTKYKYNAEIAFPELGENATGVTVKYLGLFTAATGGRMIWYTSLLNLKSLGRYETPIIKSGTVIIGID